MQRLPRSLTIISTSIPPGFCPHLTFVGTSPALPSRSQIWYSSAGVPGMMNIKRHSPCQDHPAIRSLILKRRYSELHALHSNRRFVPTKTCGDNAGTNGSYHRNPFRIKFRPKQTLSSNSRHFISSSLRSTAPIKSKLVATTLVIPLKHQFPWARGFTL